MRKVIDEEGASLSTLGAHCMCYTVQCLHAGICACMFFMNRKVKNTELCIALRNVLCMLIMRHELMRAESHIAVCCSYMSLCVYVCVRGGGSHLESHACGSCIVLCRL